METEVPSQFAAFTWTKNAIYEHLLIQTSFTYAQINYNQTKIIGRPVWYEADKVSQD